MKGLVVMMGIPGKWLSHWVSRSIFGIVASHERDIQGCFANFHYRYTSYSYNNVQYRICHIHLVFRSATTIHQAAIPKIMRVGMQAL